MIFNQYISRVNAKAVLDQENGGLGVKLPDEASDAV